MGANESKESSSSKKVSDEEKWETMALAVLKTYYLGFRGLQWHEFDRVKDTDLLQAKICFSLFGPPTEHAEVVENAYNKEQRKAAKKILDVILKVYDDSKTDALRVGFIFVACKQDKSEFTMPIFSVFVGVDKKTGADKRHFVDTQHRVYDSWKDWKSNNRLPKMRYCYPKQGFFSCSGDNSYKFDEELDPDHEFGFSPSCDISSDVLQATDITTSVLSFGAGVVGIVGLFTPLAPVVLAVAAVTGGSSAVYGAARGITRLVDKGTHGESLGDLESLTLWFSLAATPFHFLTSAVNSTLTFGAQQGRIFSSSLRMFATVLNITTLGLDSILLGMGLANLIDKAIKKDLNALDILQFSMSVFFFTNTLMQPKTASQIIRQAQDMHLNRHMTSMSDESAQAAFKSFIDRNSGDGGIQDRSKIIRTVNRMNDPNQFFKAVGPDMQVDIGGRKGRTVLVTDAHGTSTRMNPNRVIFTSPSSTFGPSAPYNFKVESKKLTKCYGKDLNDVQLNGEYIFRNMSDAQKRQIRHHFGGAAKWNQDLILTAHSIAESMGINNFDGLMNVIEIVATSVQKKSGNDLTHALKMIRTDRKDNFVYGIQRDQTTAMQLATNSGLHFDDPLTAVYHYRKHRQDFPRFLRRFGDRIDVYLGPVRDRIFDSSNLREVVTLSDGVVRYIYSTSSDQFGVVTAAADNSAHISTMYKAPDSFQEFVPRLKEYFQKAEGPLEPVDNLTQNLVRFLGLRSMQIYVVTENGVSKPLKDCVNLEPGVHEAIAHFLTGIISVQYD